MRYAEVSELAGSCEHCARVGSSPIFRIRNGLNAIICAFKPFFCVIIIT